MPSFHSIIRFVLNYYNYWCETPNFRKDVQAETCFTSICRINKFICKECPAEGAEGVKCNNFCVKVATAPGKNIVKCCK